MKFHRRFGALLLAMALFAVARAAAGVDFVVNGSFEQPALSPGSFGVFSSIPGWTTTSGSGIEVENHAAGTPFDGNQLVEMDSNDNSGMQQVIPTVAGQQYVFSFEYSPRPGVPASSNGIEVLVNGNVIDTIAQDGTSNADTVWQRFSYNVTAVGSSTTIGFLAVGTSDGVGGFLDAVSFTGPPQFAPVPMFGRSGLIALGMALACIALVTLRARRAS